SPWSRIRAELKRMVSETEYSNWLLQTAFSSHERAVLTIRVPQQVTADYIREYSRARSVPPLSISGSACSAWSSSWKRGHETLHGKSSGAAGGSAVQPSKGRMPDPSGAVCLGRSNLRTRSRRRAGIFPLRAHPLLLRSDAVRAMHRRI